tara:strand:+ start:1735 stop:2064 length:330 start_codon:yes stop_codon:yes gene_type:complete
MMFVNWHDSKAGNRTAFVTKEGRKWMYLVVFEGGKGVRLRRVKRDQKRHMRPVFRPDGSEYPLVEAVGKYIGLGRNYGMTKGAYEALVPPPTTRFQRKLDAINRKALFS